VAPHERRRRPNDVGRSHADVGLDGTLGDRRSFGALASQLARNERLDDAVATVARLTSIAPFSLISSLNGMAATNGSSANSFQRRRSSVRDKR
jgi:hypothetical protein